MNFMDVAARDDEEVGAVARLGEGGRHPTRCLEHAKIPVLRFAKGVIDYTAAALGDRHDGAHAVDVGREPAEQRQAALVDELCRLTYGLGQGNISPVDLRLAFDEWAFEAGHRLRATVL